MKVANGNMHFGQIFVREKGLRSDFKGLVRPVDS